MELKYFKGSCSRFCFFLLYICNYFYFLFLLQLLLLLLQFFLFWLDTDCYWYYLLFIVAFASYLGPLVVIGLCWRLNWPSFTPSSIHTALLLSISQDIDCLFFTVRLLPTQLSPGWES